MTSLSTEIFFKNNIYIRLLPYLYYTCGRICYTCGYCPLPPLINYSMPPAPLPFGAHLYGNANDIQALSYYSTILIPNSTNNTAQSSIPTIANLPSEKRKRTSRFISWSGLSNCFRAPPQFHNAMQVYWWHPKPVSHLAAVTRREERTQMNQTHTTTFMMGSIWK